MSDLRLSAVDRFDSGVRDGPEIRDSVRLWSKWENPLAVGARARATGKNSVKPHATPFGVSAGALEISVALDVFVVHLVDRRPGCADYVVDAGDELCESE